MDKVHVKPSADGARENDAPTPEPETGIRGKRAEAGPRRRRGERGPGRGGVRRSAAGGALARAGLIASSPVHRGDGGGRGGVDGWPCGQAPQSPAAAYAGVGSAGAPRDGAMEVCHTLCPRRERDERHDYRACVASRKTPGVRRNHSTSFPANTGVAVCFATHEMMNQHTVCSGMGRSESDRGGGRPPSQVACGLMDKPITAVVRPRA